MFTLIWLIDNIFTVVWWLVLASVVMSWLFAFNIININNPSVRQIAFGVRRLTEPLLEPIRRFLPDLGGLDISPVILLFLLELARRGVIELLFNLAR